MNCQKCRASLRLDQSLVDLNPAAYDLLVGVYGMLDYLPIRLTKATPRL